MLALRTALTAFRRAPLLSVLSVTTIAFSLFAFGLFGLVALNTQERARRESKSASRFARSSPRGRRSRRSRRPPTTSRVSPGCQVESSRAQALERARAELGEFKDVFEPSFCRHRWTSSSTGLPRSDKRQSSRGPDQSSRFVDDVRFGEEWITQLYRIRNIAGVVGAALGLAFAVVAIIIIGATIRMAVLAREQRDLDHASRRRDRRLHPAPVSDRGIDQRRARRNARAGADVYRDAHARAVSAVRDGVLRSAHGVVGIVFGALMGLMGARYRSDGIFGGYDGGWGTGDGGWGFAERAARWRSRALSFAASLSPLAASRLPAQDARIRAQRDTLERIRREREALERRAAELQSTVHDLNEEVTNLDRRADATSRIVQTLDLQLASISTEVNSASVKVSATRRSWEERGCAAPSAGRHLQARPAVHDASNTLRPIVRRAGRTLQISPPARAARPLFGRARRTVARRDQAGSRPTSHVAKRARGESQRQTPRGRTAPRPRARARDEPRASRNARSRRPRRGSSVSRRASRSWRARSRRSTRLVAGRRRRVPTRPPASTIKTSDYGKLDWPVDGSLVYTFGKAQTSSNTTIRWNGVGIKASVGTSVRSVADGKVVSVGQLGTYGLTVIIDHGGGDYSIYGSLNRSDVRSSRR